MTERSALTKLLAGSPWAAATVVMTVLVGIASLSGLRWIEQHNLNLELVKDITALKVTLEKGCSTLFPLGVNQHSGLDARVRPPLD